jgi:diadenosine tetraphosphate (Ap4A) HIT family hydrolase
MKNQHVDVDNSRLDEQRQQMEKILAAGHCPFCSENLETYHTPAILKESTHWLVTKNQWPYEHTKHHFLLIYKEHVTTLAHMHPDAGKELLELAQWLEKEYQVPGGGLAMRFGDTDYSAGTVAHIHAQFLVPDIQDTSFEPVRIKIGKTKS